MPKKLYRSFILKKRLVEPQSRPGLFGGENNRLFLPGIEFRIIQYIALSYTYYG